MSELDELLARAIELEQKAEAGDLDPDELAAGLDELAADAGGLDVNEPTDDDLSGFEAEATAVEEGGDEWADSDLDDLGDPEDHEALEAEAEGVDFEEPDDEEPALERAEDLGRMTTDEEKAAGWAPCPLCGSTERDEFTDDTARCSECGGVLFPAVAKKHYDFEEPDDEPAGPVAEVKSLDEMDEFDLLRARRLEL